jgi:hypothetical protein
MIDGSITRSHLLFWSSTVFFSVVFMACSMARLASYPLPAF